MSSGGGYRGLQNFINGIRQCQSKEGERARIDKELANIRTKFKSDRGLSSYEKKKYIWKLLYIYVLGYDVEFGHMEAVAKYFDAIRIVAQDAAVSSPLATPATPRSATVPSLRAVGTASSCSAAYGPYTPQTIQ